VEAGFGLIAIIFMMNFSRFGPDWLSRWQASHAVKKEYEVIDGLRGVAIVLVMACHLLTFSKSQSTGAQFMGEVFSAGRCGVLLFFGLSGFLISLPFWVRKQQGHQALMPHGYVSKRFWKIYPPFAVSVAFCVPIYAKIHGVDYAWDAAWRWLIGFPLFAPISPYFNGVMWTLIVEVHFYLTLPILFFLTRSLQYNSVLAFMFLAIFVAPSSYLIYLELQGEGPSFIPMLDTMYPSSFAGFGFGVLLAGLEVSKRLRRSLASLAIVGVVLLSLSMVAQAWSNVFWGGPWVVSKIIYFTQLGAVGLMVLLVLDSQPRLSQILSVRPLRWLGIVSYEWYLFHQPIHHLYLHLVGAAEGSLLKWFLRIGVVFVSSLAIAAVTYLFFSKPILEWGRRRSLLLSFDRGLNR